MSSVIVILPLLWPLCIGIVQLLLRERLAWQRLLAVLSSCVFVGIAIAALELADKGYWSVYNLGNWLAPFGIVLVLDRLSALMLVLSAVLALAALWYAIATEVDAQGKHFHVLWQLQLFGLSGAFLTGDVFNLFVFFEVVLLASYGLMLHGGGRERTIAGFHYVSINLIGTTLFLLALGALYAGLGSLNLAQMAKSMAHLPIERSSLVASAGLLLLAVFALKAGMFPLYLWLPATYASTSAPVAALFAIMTKVGIYAIIRVHGLLFNATIGELAALHNTWLLGGGLLTVLLAALGVMAAKQLTEQIAYLLLTSVGVLLIALGLATPQALSAGLYYIIHSTLIGGALFLLAEQIIQGRGSKGNNLQPAVLQQRAWLGGLFFLSAIALAGLPPLSGFLGKLMLLKAALGHNYAVLVITTILISSLLLCISLARTGSLLFYRLPPATIRHKPEAVKPLNRLASISTVSLLTVSPLLVLGALPLTKLTQAIATQLTDIQGYTQAVLNHPVVGAVP